ncbi:MAG: hypothetical protein ACYC7B_04290 [Burkholderiales bacterium]
MKLTHKLTVAALLLFGVIPVQADTNNAGLQQVSTTRKTGPANIADQGQSGTDTTNPNRLNTGKGTVTPGPRPDANSALQQVSTTRKNVTGGPAFSATNEPIPGIDIIVKKPSAKSSISDQSAGGNLSRTGRANISDQGQSGVSTSYGKGTSGGTVTPGPRPSAGDAIPGIDVDLGTHHGKAATRAISDQAQGGVLTHAKIPASGKISENQSPLPSDRPASKSVGKSAAPAIFDRWGSYSASNPVAAGASPQKDAEHNSAQDMAAAREKYNAQSGAGSIAGPTPLMNGPNAGMPTLTPALGPAIPMSPGVMSPGGH